MEGTRVGLGNELDILVSFEHFEKCPFSLIANDPFHISANSAETSLLSEVLDSNGRLNLDAFMETFFSTIELVLDEIFSSKRNPSCLSRVTTNHRPVYRPCQKCFGDTQCCRCSVAVSRTKIGACLQFSWTKSAYCSIDIVPKFDIEPVESMKLAFMINRGMANLPPDVWFRHLRNYVETDMVLQDTLDEGCKMVNAVVLRQITRPGYR